jgi:hypothetical protein
MLTATYSPEDNKLRLYAATRLDADTYTRVKAAGFAWAPKQELFVAPMWTPEREDLLLDLAGDITDEDTSLADRAEERADRFRDYSTARAQDADHAQKAVHAIADMIPFGQPILVGHHSEKHARKDAERIDNGMRKAVSLWKQSHYWTDRAGAAIRHAKHKERPDVRARRIKGLEADLRKYTTERDGAAARIKSWGNDLANFTKKDGTPTTFQERALYFCNHFEHLSACFPLAEYPRTEHTYEGMMSLWSALNDGIITPEQAKAIALPAHERAHASSSRWIAHTENRLAYERAMLAADGGTVADKTGPEVGGACKCWASCRGGWSYIVKVNKVSVSVLDNWGNGGKNFTRTIPFDKLSKILTAAEVQAARDTEQLIELDTKQGFILRDDVDRKPTIEVPASALTVEEFAAL